MQKANKNLRDCLERRKKSVDMLQQGTHERVKRDGSRVLETTKNLVLAEIKTTKSRGGVGGFYYINPVWLLTMEMLGMSNVGCEHLSPFIRLVLHRFGICCPERCGKLACCFVSMSRRA